MANKIRLGMLGLGRIGMHMANKEVASFPELYEIVAVCDLIEDRAKQLGEKTGAKIYTDYEEMLKQEDIEMVYVATRSCDHFKHTMMAFEAGKDVLLEKPATISYEQLGGYAVEDQVKFYPVISTKKSIALTIKGTTDKTATLIEGDSTSVQAPEVTVGAKQEFLGWANAQNATTRYFQEGLYAGQICPVFSGDRGDRPLLAQAGCGGNGKV